MDVSCDYSGITEAEYHGRILDGNYGPSLKARVADCITSSLCFQKIGNPAISYISAWPKGEDGIWYEFASNRFTELMGCGGKDLAANFRKGIIDQRIYHYDPLSPTGGMEIIEKNTLNSGFMALRKQAEETGAIEALYKLSPKPGEVLWLKDQAVVEIHEGDKICLSLGNLTVVTKEMQCEEERLKREKLLVALETAGGICHELNQPLQSVNGYSEFLLKEMAPDAPLFKIAEKIREQSRLMGEITTKLMEITEYRTRDYVDGSRIVDIHK